MFTCRGDKLLDLLDIHINTNNGKPANNDLNDDSDHSYCEVGPPSESPCPELDPELQELLEEIENDDLENEIFDDDDKDPDYIPEDSVPSEVMFPNAATECSSTTECEDVTAADPVSPTSEIGDQVEKCVEGPKTRNRIPDTDNWKRNAVKRKIRTGEEHKSASGRVIAAKLVKFQDCSRCVRKCNENFSESKRNEINQDYWNLGDVDKQRLFLNSLVSEVEKKVTRTAADVSRRQKTRNYYFNKAGDQIQVCQRFFLATLSITDTVIKNMLRKRAESGVIEKDRRGCHIPGVKKPESSREYIINHINSFPRIPSHYCRKDTKKDYLPQDLNLQKMYDLYVVKCSEDSVTPEKISFYRNIFHTNFNIAFHCPRKDVCDQCYKYERMDVEEKEKMKEAHDSHLARKVKARNLRDEFKEKALNGECNFAEFDFEAVRYCPSLKAKAIFYKRRLAVYNLTVYNVATKYATNYMWHEATAGRGSKEVASCLFNHMKEKSNEESTHWVFMSDTCGGQNRNVNVTTMFLYAVQKLNISLIDQLFFEPGHSQMECDSVHAQIEKASRDIEIFDPSGWYTTVRLASRGKKYEVNEVNQSEVYDFQELQKVLIKNRKIDMKGNVVRWLDITWLQYRKTDPMLVFFKYDQSEEFEAFAISRRERRKFSIDKLILKPAYCGTLPIENNKLSDLMKLCSSGVIREQYHSFYESLVGDSVVNADDE